MSDEERPRIKIPGGRLLTPQERRERERREAEGPAKPEITHNVCGPSTGKCKCDCPNSCEHKWDDPNTSMGRAVSVTCSRCEMPAIEHDLWVGP